MESLSKNLRLLLAQKAHNAWFTKWKVNHFKKIKCDYNKIQQIFIKILLPYWGSNWVMKNEESTLFFLKITNNPNRNRLEKILLDAFV